MRKAFEILDGYLKDVELTDHQYHWMKQAINEARKECIQECAKRAKTVLMSDAVDVDKQSILNLINELK